MNELINIKQKNNKYKCKISSKDEFENFNEAEYKKYIGNKNNDEIKLTKEYNDDNSIQEYYKCDLLQLRDFKILPNIKLYDIKINDIGNNDNYILSSFFIAFFNHLYLLKPELFTNENIFLEQWDSNRELKFSIKYNNFDEEGEDTFQLGSKIKSIKNILRTYDTEIIIYLLDKKGKNIIKSFSINKSKNKCQMIYYGGLYYLIYDKDNNSYFPDEKQKEVKKKILISNYEKKLFKFLNEYYDIIKIRSNEFKSIDGYNELDTKEKYKNKLKEYKNAIKEKLDFMSEKMKLVMKNYIKKYTVHVNLNHDLNASEFVKYYDDLLKDFEKAENYYRIYKSLFDNKRNNENFDYIASFTSIGREKKIVDNKVTPKRGVILKKIKVTNKDNYTISMLTIHQLNNITGLLFDFNTNERIYNCMHMKLFYYLHLFDKNLDGGTRGSALDRTIQGRQYTFFQYLYEQGYELMVQYKTNNTFAKNTEERNDLKYGRKKGNWHMPGKDYENKYTGNVNTFIRFLIQYVVYNKSKYQIVIDLSGHDLNFLYFYNLKDQLKGVSFKDADLHGIVFEDVDLSGCNFKGADLTGARFLGTTILKNCDFTSAKLYDVTFNLQSDSNDIFEGCKFVNTISRKITYYKNYILTTALTNKYKLINGYLIGPYVSLKDIDGDEDLYKSILQNDIAYVASGGMKINGKLIDNKIIGNYIIIKGILFQKSNNDKGLNLRHLDFEKVGITELENILFNNCDLTGTNFGNITIKNCTFNGAYSNLDEIKKNDNNSIFKLQKCDSFKIETPDKYFLFLNTKSYTDICFEYLIEKENFASSKNKSKKFTNDILDKRVDKTIGDYYNSITKYRDTGAKGYRRFIQQDIDILNFGYSKEVIAWNCLRRIRFYNKTNFKRKLYTKATQIYNGLDSDNKNKYFLYNDKIYETIGPLIGTNFCNTTFVTINFNGFNAKDAKFNNNVQFNLANSIQYISNDTTPLIEQGTKYVKIINDNELKTLIHNNANASYSRGFDILPVNITSVDFTGSIININSPILFTNCDFSNCTITGDINNCKFTTCTFKLLKTKLSSNGTITVDNREYKIYQNKKNTNEYVLIMENCDLSDCNLEGNTDQINIENCKLYGTILENFTIQYNEKTDFFDTTLKNCSRENNDTNNITVKDNKNTVYNTILQSNVNLINLKFTESSNIQKILLRSKMNLKQSRFETTTKVKINNSKIVNNDYQFCYFKNLEFNNIRFSDCDFRNCSMEDVTFNKCNFTNCKFNKKGLEYNSNNDMNNPEIYETYNKITKLVNNKKPKILNFLKNNDKFQKLELEVKSKYLKIKDKSEGDDENEEKDKDENLFIFNKLYFYDCIFKKGNTFSDREFKNSKFEVCKFYGTKFANCDLQENTFEGSKLYGISLNGANITKANLNNCIIKNSGAFQNMKGFDSALKNKLEIYKPYPKTGNPNLDEDEIDSYKLNFEQINDYNITYKNDNDDQYLLYNKFSNIEREIDDKYEEVKKYLDKNNLDKSDVLSKIISLYKNYNDNDNDNIFILLKIKLYILISFLKFNIENEYDHKYKIRNIKIEDFEVLQKHTNKIRFDSDDKLYIITGNDKSKIKFSNNNFKFKLDNSLVSFRFEKCEFDNYDFEDCKLKKIEFINCTFYRCKLPNKITDIKFLNCEIDVNSEFNYDVNNKKNIAINTSDEINLSKYTYGIKIIKRENNKINSYINRVTSLFKYNIFNKNLRNISNSKNYIQKIYDFFIKSNFEYNPITLVNKYVPIRLSKDKVAFRKRNSGFYIFAKNAFLKMANMKFNNREKSIYFATIENGILDNCFLKYSIFMFCNFNNTNINNCDFTKTNLSYSSFECNDIKEYQGNNFSCSNISFCSFKNIKFKNLSNKSTKFINCFGKHAKFENCEFDNVIFNKANFEFAKFTDNCEFTNCKFYGCNFSNSNFQLHMIKGTKNIKYIKLDSVLNNPNINNLELDLRGVEINKKINLSNKFLHDYNDKVNNDYLFEPDYVTEVKNKLRDLLKKMSNENIQKLIPKSKGTLSNFINRLIEYDEYDGFDNRWNYNYTKRNFDYYENNLIIKDFIFWDEKIFEKNENLLYQIVTILLLKNETTKSKKYKTFGKEISIGEINKDKFENLINNERVFTINKDRNNKFKLKLTLKYDETYKVYVKIEDDGNFRYFECINSISAEEYLMDIDNLLEDYNINKYERTYNNNNKIKIQKPNLINRFMLNSLPPYQNNPVKINIYYGDKHGDLLYSLDSNNKTILLGKNIQPINEKKISSKKGTVPIVSLKLHDYYKIKDSYLFGDYINSSPFTCHELHSVLKNNPINKYKILSKPDSVNPINVISIDKLVIDTLNNDIKDSTNLLILAPNAIIIGNNLALSITDRDINSDLDNLCENLDLSGIKYTETSTSRIKFHISEKYLGDIDRIQLPPEYNFIEVDKKMLLVGQNCNFNNINFSNVTIQNLNFINCDFTNCIFNNTCFVNCNFKYSTIDLDKSTREKGCMLYKCTGIMSTILFEKDDYIYFNKMLYKKVEEQDNIINVIHKEQNNYEQIDYPTDKLLNTQTLVNVIFKKDDLYYFSDRFDFDKFNVNESNVNESNLTFKCKDDKFSFVNIPKNIKLILKNNDNTYAVYNQNNKVTFNKLKNHNIRFLKHNIFTISNELMKIFNEKFKLSTKRNKANVFNVTNDYIEFTLGGSNKYDFRGLKGKRQKKALKKRRKAQRKARVTNSGLENVLDDLNYNVIQTFENILNIDTRIDGISFRLEQGQNLIMIIPIGPILNDNKIQNKGENVNIFDFNNDELEIEGHTQRNIALFYGDTMARDDKTHYIASDTNLSFINFSNSTFPQIDLSNSDFSNCILVSTNFDNVTTLTNIKLHNITYDEVTKNKLKSKNVYLVKYEETEGVNKGHAIGNNIDIVNLNLEGCFDFVENTSVINLGNCLFHKEIDIHKLLNLTQNIKNLRRLPINEGELMKIINSSDINESIQKFIKSLKDEKEESTLYEAGIKRKKLKKMKQKERSKRFEKWAENNDWEMKYKKSSNIIYSQIIIDENGFEKEIEEFRSNLIRTMINEEKMGESKLYTIADIRDLLNGCELYFKNNITLSTPTEYKLYQCKHKIHSDGDNIVYALVGPGTICRNCKFTDKIFDNNMNFCQFIDCEFTRCNFNGNLNCANFEGCEFTNTLISSNETKHIRIIFSKSDPTNLFTDTNKFWLQDKKARYSLFGNEVCSSAPTDVLDISFRNEANNDKWKVLKSFENEWIIFDKDIKLEEFEKTNYQTIIIKKEKEKRVDGEDVYKINYGIFEDEIKFHSIVKLLYNFDTTEIFKTKQTAQRNLRQAQTRIQSRKIMIEKLWIKGSNWNISYIPKGYGMSYQILLDKTFNIDQDFTNYILLNNSEVSNINISGINITECNNSNFFNCKISKCKFDLNNYDNNTFIDCSTSDLSSDKKVTINNIYFEKDNSNGIKFNIFDEKVLNYDRDLSKFDFRNARINLSYKQLYNCRSKGELHDNIILPVNTILLKEEGKGNWLLGPGINSNGMFVKLESEIEVPINNLRLREQDYEIINSIERDNINIEDKDIYCLYESDEIYKIISYTKEKTTCKIKKVTVNNPKSHIGHIFSCENGSFIAAQFQILEYTNKDENENENITIKLEENILNSKFEYSDLSFTKWPSKFKFKMKKDEYFENANLSYADFRGCLYLNKIKGFILDKTNSGELCTPFYDKNNYKLISTPKAKNDQYGRNKWRFKKTN